MVKFLLSICLAAACFGGVVAEVATKITGKDSPQIQALFANDSDYLDDKNQPDISKISETLKFNSLLNLSYKQNVSFELKIKTQQSSPILLLKITKDALSKLGYNDVLTTEFINDDNVSLNLSINSRFILDPGVFYTALKQTNTSIKTIEKMGNFGYFYELDLSNTNAENTQTGSGENELSKPLEPYIISAKNFKYATIEAKPEDYWVPVVNLLDKRLNLISQKTGDEAVKSLEIVIPSDAKYIMIDDKNSLENIKHGLKIYLK